MLVLGVDAGSSYLKGAIVEDGSLADHAVVEARGGVDDVLERMLSELGADLSDFDLTVVTGYGREALKGRFDATAPELPSVALGAWKLGENVRTVIDVGGQDSKVLRVEEGRVVDFQVNDKCAAGTGRFIESVCRRLGVELTNLDRVVSDADGSVSISSMCAVFAESEVITLVNQGVEEGKILRGVLESVAERVATMARRVSPEPEIVLVGGLARSRTFAEILSEALEVEVTVPRHAQLAGALGAALWAMEREA